MPEGFATTLTSMTTSLLDVVGQVAETVVTTFPLNLAVVGLVIGMGVGLYRRFKR